MSRPSGSSAAAGKARIAVIGSASPEGGHVRSELAAQGVPGARVDLFGATRGEAVLSEYDGEARLIQDPEPQAVAGHDVVFLCEPGGSSARLLQRLGPDVLVLDLVGCARNAPLVHADIRPASEPARGRPLAVPHALSLVLAELLHPLERTLGIRTATAVVLRPAADFGQPGIEELREQTVRILRFDRPPVDTFGRQLAFNVIPQGLLSGGEAGLAGRVAVQVATLLGWEENRLALQLVAVPVFFGHALIVRIEPTRSADAREIAEALSCASGVSCKCGTEAGTPMEFNEARETVVTEIAEDGANGFWIWAVAGEAGAAAAQQAVRVAERLADL